MGAMAAVRQPRRGVAPFLVAVTTVIFIALMLLPAARAQPVTGVSDDNLPYAYTLRQTIEPCRKGA